MPTGPSTFVHDFRKIYDETPDALGPTITDELQRAEKISIADVGWAMDAQTRIFLAADAFFDKHDLLITPATSVQPFPHEDLYPKHIDGEEMGGYLRWEAISYGVTLFAGPAAVIPCGVGPGGMPMAVQIISRARSDAGLLEIAHALETVFAASPDLATPVPDPEVREKTDDSKSDIGYC